MTKKFSLPIVIALTLSILFVIPQPVNADIPGTATGGVWTAYTSPWNFAKIDAAGGVLFTRPYDVVYRMAVDPRDGAVWVAGRGPLTKYDADGNILFSRSGFQIVNNGGKGNLDVDWSDGSVWIRSDNGTYAGKVVKLNMHGEIQFILEGFSGSANLVVNQQTGDVYVAKYSAFAQATIYKYDRNGNLLLEGPAFSYCGNMPAIAFDQDNQVLYSGTSQSGVIHKYDADLAPIWSVDTNLSCSGPYDPLDVSPLDGSIWVVEPSGTGSSAQHRASNGSLLTSRSNVTSIEFNEDGTYWMLDGGTLKKYAADDSLLIDTGADRGAPEARVYEAQYPPTDIALSGNTIPENELIGTTVGTLSSTDPDTGDAFTYSLVDSDNYPDNTLFSIAGDVLQSAEVFDYETKSTYSVKVRSTDIIGHRYDKVFTINVTNLNEPPTAVNDDYSTLKDEALYVPALGVLTNDLDPEDDTLTAVHLSGPPSGEGELVLGAGGGIYYLPPSGWLGTTSFTYLAQDAELESGVATVTIHVNESNDPPTDIELSNDIIPENSGTDALIGTLSTVDPDLMDDFAYTFVSGEDDDDNADFTLIDDQLRASSNFDHETKSTYSIRIRSTDQGNLWVEKAFQINISDVNEAPAADDQEVHVDENSALPITLTGSDVDGDAYNFVLVTLPSNGVLTWTPPSITYTPSKWFVGMDDFQFRVIDEHGLSSPAAIISIEVVDVNQGPTGIDLSPQSLPENAGEDALVGEFITEDPDSADTFSYELVSGMGDDDNASFTIQGDQLRTAVNFNYEITQNLSVRVSSTDSGDLLTEEIFLITIIDVNDAPVGNDQDIETVEETPVIITLTGTDEDGDPLVFDVSDPTHGTLSGTAPELTYQPDEEFTGIDTFTFTVSDGSLISNPSTISITVLERAFDFYYIPILLLGED